MFSKALIAATLAAATASAANVNIDVSDSSGSFTFSPNSATANVGDTVIFTFKATSHTVAEGSFDSPCQPASNAFYSGEQSPPTTFSVNVSSTDPIWYYCSTPHHCQSGMVGVINPPSGQTVSDYANKAQSASSNTAPSASSGSGGTLNASGSPSSSSSASGSAASGSSTGTSTGSSTGSSSGSSTATSSAASSSSTSKSGAGAAFQASSILAILGGIVAAAL